MLSDSIGRVRVDFRLAQGELRVDSEADLRLELPPSVDLPAPDPTASKKETLDRIEGG